MQAPPSILVVEDELIVARDICLQLGALGYAVAGEATRGAQAIALVTQLRPDLVLMDIQLDGAMDGIEAAQHIVAQRDLPIVFLTAFSADEQLQRAKLAQPYGYILKPFSERELRTVLEMALYKHQADARSRELEQRNQTLLDSLTHGVISFDAQGIIESCNASAAAMLGYPAAALLKKNVSTLMSEPQRRQQDLDLQRTSGLAPHRYVCRHREVHALRHDGSTFPADLTVSGITVAGQPGYIAILRDLSASQQSQARIDHLVYFDELTGLPNRQRLLLELPLVIDACARAKQYGALIFLDVDHFRRINESIGPAFGDALLRELALRLPACVRDRDKLVHYGGDEFMVILDNLGESSAAAAAHVETVATKIRQALTQPFSWQGRTCTCTVSIGIALFNASSDQAEDLLKMADVALYQAKGAGRDTVRFFDPSLQAQALARRALEAELRTALTQQEFVLHYQLQVNTALAPIGVEALVRWQHPQRGLVSPAQFIGLAEETGLILPLGQWVLETACKQQVQWSRQAETAHWRVAVNVSALQFAQDDFVDSVAWALTVSGAQPQHIKLELTESMLLRDVPSVIAKMQAIKALGVSFSLDDFGTGYSSLAYLKRLPLDQLKIDQSFVRELSNDADDGIISQTIVALGHNLGMQVIAEGVECARQHETLQAMGCDAFQGYLFGRPVAPDALPG